MKKVFTTITFTFLLLCLSISVYAKTSATITDDLQTITFNGSDYIRLDAMMYAVDFVDIKDTVALTETQAKTIEKIDMKIDMTENVLYTRIRYLDGTIIAAEFLHENYIDMYDRIQSDELDTYLIDFKLPRENVLAADIMSSLGESTTLTGDSVKYCDSFLVYAKSDDYELTAITGALIHFNFDYYYVDFNDMNVPIRESFEPWQHSALPLKQIVDEELIKQIESSLSAFYKAGGDSYSDSLNKSYISNAGYDDYSVSDYASEPEWSYVVSLVFCILLYGIVPLVILILSIIISSRKKGTYRTVFRIASIIAGAELLTFIGILFILI